jgi:hypothetical protein
MCFVAYIPVRDGFILGSNRDEHLGRLAATPPKQVMLGGKKVLMPVDGKAGGTWIALRDDAVTMVLLNGAFINHLHKPPYKHSRGLIIPQLMEEPDPVAASAQMSLDGIEPFTLLIINNQPFVRRWDGEILNTETPDPYRPFCLSSATLYNENQQLLRSQWFFDWIHKESNPEAERLLHWMGIGGFGASDTDILLRRADGIQTVSHTVVQVLSGSLQMLYRDYRGSSGESTESYGLQ